MKTEFWVMRRLLDSTEAADPAVAPAVLKAVNEGKVAITAHGDVLEPVEVFDTENEAATHREVLRRKHPSEDFRVIMNTDAVV